MWITHFRPTTGKKLTDGLESWLALMRENGIALVILSNSKEKRVKPFAEKNKLPYVSLGLKPLPFKFRRALRVIKTGRKNTAIVGDQIFTDTLGGNLFGGNNNAFRPIKPESSARFKFKRRLERAVFKIYKIKTRRCAEMPKFGPAGNAESFAKMGYKNSLTYPII